MSLNIISFYRYVKHYNDGIRINFLFTLKKCEIFVQSFKEPFDFATDII